MLEDFLKAMAKRHFVLSLSDVGEQGLPADYFLVPDLKRKGIPGYG